MTLNRREFVQLAAAMGASLAWGGSARASTTGWHERRELYPEGVASGDPDPSSVILWTRRPFESGGRRVLTVEVAEDEAFRRVVAKASAPVSAESDWTTRVLVGHLKPARVYWYRFTDGEGTGAASAGRSPRRWRTIHGRSTSPSSAARTSMKASSMAIAG
jgi:alkaline phosphatase D